MQGTRVSSAAYRAFGRQYANAPIAGLRRGGFRARFDHAQNGNAPMFCLNMRQARCRRDVAGHQNRLTAVAEQRLADAAGETADLFQIAPAVRNMRLIRHIHEALIGQDRLQTANHRQAAQSAVEYADRRRSESRIRARRHRSTLPAVCTPSPGAVACPDASPFVRTGTLRQSDAWLS